MGLFTPFFKARYLDLIWASLFWGGFNSRLDAKIKLHLFSGYGL
jgi:hypothetical protein